MYEFEITRWFVNDDPEIMPVAEVSTWRSHWTTGAASVDAEGNTVYEIIPQDGRARQLGALCPPEVPPAEDWWFNFSTVDVRAIGVISYLGDATGYPPPESDYWTWLNTTPMPGWTAVDEATYDTAKAAWDAWQAQLVADDEIAQDAAWFQLITDLQDAWDAKYAALIGDGISPATAELLLGPRPV